ncbi:HNH endonuclease [candidate division KSB1 bacterium]|nr:HNH endonuclease [candidate division KSB1 bacterium]
MFEAFEYEEKRRHIAREKIRAKALKKTQWWQTKIAAGICHYCGKKFPTSELTMDHIVPLSKGGKSVRGNVVPCCKTCNSNKQSDTPVDIILKKLEDDQPKDDSLS